MLLALLPAAVVLAGCAVGWLVLAFDLPSGPAGTATLPGCDDGSCAGPRVGVTGVTTLVPSGGALVPRSAAGLRAPPRSATGRAFRR